MSRKINPITMVVLILTVSGYLLPIIYISLFSSNFLLYCRLPDKLESIAIGALICVIGGIIGIARILSKKINSTNRMICIVCTLLCFVLILCTFSLPCTGRENARRVSCASGLRQIYLALRQYAMDYSDYYPPPNGAAGLEMLRKNEYLTDYAIYTCPSSETVKGKDNQALTEITVDYIYIGGFNEKSAPKQPLLYDKPNNHGGYFGNVLFVDGTVKSIEGNPWTTNIKK